MKVCIAPTHLLSNVSLGGHAWVFLNWALSLQAAGCEIVVADVLGASADPEERRHHVDAFRRRLGEVGLTVDVTVLSLDGENPSDESELEGHVVPLARIQEEADLFLNFRYVMPSEIVAGFSRTALVNIDPGLLQCWMSDGHVRPAAHDVYFTTGETVGRPGAVFPDCGLDWHHVPPPVFLDAWPVTPAAESAPYTTVTNWWGEYEVLLGETVNNEKRTEFLEYIDLPRHTGASLELAVYHEDGHESEFERLREHGWRARPAHEVSATPNDYRDYIRRSRGEFSCAKRSCMHLRNAWISDRTLCYLASGRPAVVQHTGPSSVLPDDSGLMRFRSMSEAAAMLDEVERNHEAHSASARDLVEARFDGTRLMADLLDRAMSHPIRRRVDVED